MARRRLVVLLPGLSVIITSGLWFWARAQYLGVICPPTGICRDHGWIGWTDYTPIPILVAGMLNAPVAIFCQPLYRLLGEDTKKWELIALLVGVAAQWSYIGWVVDTRRSARSSETLPHRIAGTAGCLFGVWLLIATISMYHIGLFYKAVVVLWSLLIWRHFLNFFRNSPAPGQHH
jgi:hypothetical protein